MPNTCVDCIEEHYKEEARICGNSKQSTMRDKNIRDMEIATIKKYIGALKQEFSNPRILEIGCGNGYTAEEITKEYDVDLTCIDYCNDMIEIAKKRNV